MTREEQIKEVEDLFTSLTDASIKKAFGPSSLGGCKDFNIESYPEQHKPYILKYLEHGTNSVEVALDYYDTLKD
jgi:hypothetical protein